MKPTFSQYLAEDVKVTPSQPKELERVLDRMFKSVGIDVEFSSHFFDRVNDSRNGEQIKVRELRDLFRKTYDKYKDKLVKFGDNWQAVLKDIQTDINLPIFRKKAAESLVRRMNYEK